MFELLNDLTLSTLWKVRGGLLHDLVTAVTNAERYQIKKALFIVDYLIFCKWEV